MPVRSPARRCAIYTRKSSEEGLEQAFNSLDAQREACAAYIASQRHEGWTLLPTLYDDGGISGGTLERPALKQLLADIAAGKVDLVVVYKVDRLTRSLADFAKIVDVFDGHGASFVSVTQQFNTATSMGRLTLNMLLSFAQFEREVTGERIRDKIAASKRKGMWMGGSVPLGYDIVDRKLVVNPQEAEMVRGIFRSYLMLGSVRLLKQHLEEAGIRSKQRPNAASAKMRGGQVLARGALYLMLQNQLYRGEIAHQGNIYPGEHEAIIDPDLWEAVQTRLQDNRVEQDSGARAQSPSLLAGLLIDAEGQRLVPTHAVKGARRYRYYVSKALQTGNVESPASTTAAASGLRLPAGELERVVSERIHGLLSQPTELFHLISLHLNDGTEQRQVLDRAKETARLWPEQSGRERRALLRQMLARVVVTPTRLDLHVQPTRLIALLGGTITEGAESFILSVPVQLRRLGLEMRLLVEGATSHREPDPTLIRLIVRAITLRDKLLATGLGIGELAARQGVTGSYLVRVLRLAFLAPDIVAAILDGRQPLGLTAEKLVRASRLPLDWGEQRQSLGFG